MNCPKCGASTPDLVAACAQCGYSFYGPSPNAPITPPPPQPQSYAQPVAAQNVPNYLVPAILVTILCCLPFGIVALIYASQVNGKVATGNVYGAMEDSRKAKTWVIVSLATGILPMILIFAAIAIPNLLRSRNVANEASAVGSVRTLNTAEVTYSRTYPNVGYTCTIQELGSGSTVGSNVCASTSGANQHSACLIDDDLASGVKNGYKFSLENCADYTGRMTHYEILARPLQPGTSGERSFCSDESGVIKSTTTAHTIEACLANGAPLR